MHFDASSPGQASNIYVLTAADPGVNVLPPLGSPYRAHRSASSASLLDVCRLRLLDLVAVAALPRARRFLPKLRLNPQAIPMH